MAESFVLNKAHTFTTTSCRLNVAQGVLPGDFLEDRFYLFDSFYTGAEPTREPDAVLTSLSAYVDFTGLAPGRIRYVMAWRRYTDVNKAHLRATQAAINQESVPVCTLLDTVSINPEVQTTLYDLSGWNDLRPWWNIRNQRVLSLNDTVMGDFIRIDGVLGQGQIHGRRRYNSKKPITAKCRVRFSTSGGVPWWFFAVSGGESEDASIAHFVGNNSFTYGFNLPWVATGTSLLGPEYHDLEIHSDGVGTVTYKVNGVVIGTKSVAWTVDPFLAFGATEEGSSSSFTCDFSNIEVTGEEVGGWTDSSAYISLWDLDNASIVAGTEWQNGYPSDTSPHFHQQGGGFTNYMVAAKPDVDGTRLWASRDQLAFHAGTAIITSPKYVLTDRIRYNSLRLIGSTRSGGTLKTWIKKADGSLVPDSEVPYNSFGFTPEYGIEKVIDLRAVTATSIYFYTEIYNPTQGVTDYNAYAYQSGPPILKQISVDFFIDPITPLEFIPRILTSQGYRPGRVYLKSADGFRRVNAEVLT